MDSLESLRVTIETFHIMVWIPESREVPELFGDVYIQQGINYPSIILGLEGHMLACEIFTWMSPHPIRTLPTPPPYMHTTHTLPMKIAQSQRLPAVLRDIYLPQYHITRPEREWDPKRSVRTALGENPCQGFPVHLLSKAKETFKLGQRQSKWIPYWPQVQRWHFFFFLPKKDFFDCVLLVWRQGCGQLWHVGTPKEA